MATNPDAPADPTAGVPIIAGGVDWLTCTAPDGHPADDLWREARRWLELEEAAGNRVSAASPQGYRGLSCGGVGVGRRPDGVMVRLSGSTANLAWRDVLVHAHNVSRLDIQATIDGGDLLTDLAWVHWLDLDEAPKRRGRPIGAEVRMSNQTGQTLYVGSRKSEAYGRCYDKHAEQPKHYSPGAWRYEVEFHDATAGSLAGRLANAEAPTTAAAATCHAWFLSRGIRPLFTPPAGVVVPDPPARETSVDRSLGWVRDYVASTVAWLCEVGATAEVIDALASGLHGAGRRRRTRREVAEWMQAVEAAERTRLALPAPSEPSGDDGLSRGPQEPAQPARSALDRPWRHSEPSNQGRDERGALRPSHDSQVGG